VSGVHVLEQCGWIRHRARFGEGDAGLNVAQDFLVHCCGRLGAEDALRREASLEQLDRVARFQ
jgi:hypothetical protein